MGAQEEDDGKVRIVRRERKRADADLRRRQHASEGRIRLHLQSEKASGGNQTGRWSERERD